MNDTTTKHFPAKFVPDGEEPPGCAADIPDVEPGRVEHLIYGELPSDNEHDNTLRARWAGTAVKAYAQQTGILHGEPVETAISDLLADLRHLVDALRDEDGEPLDFDELSELGGRRYAEELRGDWA